MFRFSFRNVSNRFPSSLFIPKICIYRKKAVPLHPNMEKHKNLRWVYIGIAVIASVLLLCRPVFSFQQDKGILYTRHYKIDNKKVTVIQTGLEDHIEYVLETRSIIALHVLGHLMLWSSVAVLLLFFDPIRQHQATLLPIVFAALYYVFVIYYAVDITDRFFATLYPSWPVLMPAVVIEMMVLVRKGIHHEQLESLDGESDE